MGMGNSWSGWSNAAAQGGEHKLWEERMKSWRTVRLVATDQPENSGRAGTRMGRAAVRRLAMAALAAASLCLANYAWAADGVSGRVLTAGAPIANSTVTLWTASAGAPTQLAQAKTDADGHFALTT